MFKYTGSAKLRGTLIAAAVFAASVPAMGYAHYVYTERATGGNESPGISDGAATGFVICWDQQTVTTGRGTMYGEGGTGYEIGARVKCEGYDVTPYSSDIKDAPDGYLDTSYQNCPSGVDSEWAQGRLLTH